GSATASAGSASSGTSARMSKSVTGGCGPVPSGCLGGVLDGLLDGAYVEEGALRNLVTLAVGNLPEAADGVGQLDVASGFAGEDLGGEERLAQKALDFARSGHHQLVLLGQLVHAEDGNDVLQLPVALEDVLHLARHRVVLGTHHRRVQNAAGGVERVHRWVDAELGDGAAQHNGRVQVGKGGGRGRVGEVVGRHVDGLHRGDR